MLKRITAAGLTILVGAAAAVVFAQFPWESSGSFSSSSSDESSSSSDDYSSGSSSDDSYSPSPSDDYSSSSDSESSDSGAESAAETKAKPEKPKRERTAAPARAGFNTQKTCPVCNSTKIKKNLFVSRENSRIHVCSASCLGRVKRNPGAFEKILEERGEGPENR